MDASIISRPSAATAPAPDLLLRAGVSAISVLVLTSIHHAYGAVIYDTPWRLHILYFAVPAAVAIAALLDVGRRWPTGGRGRTARGLALVLIVAFPVIMIGMFEGGYNHLLKNLLYFAGAKPTLLADLFPPPLYEMPNDLLFEATGIAQFVVALVAAAQIVRYTRAPSAPRSTSQAPTVS